MWQWGKNFIIHLCLIMFCQLHRDLRNKVCPNFLTILASEAQFIFRRYHLAFKIFHLIFIFTQFLCSPLALIFSFFNTLFEINFFVGHTVVDYSWFNLNVKQYKRYGLRYARYWTGDITPLLPISKDKNIIISVLDVVNSAFIRGMFLEKVASPISSKLREKTGSKAPQLYWRLQNVILNIQEKSAEPVGKGQCLKAKMWSSPLRWIQGQRWGCAWLAL